MESLDTNSLKPTGGFAAITPTAPKGPLAITKVVRGPDGQMKTIYIDARTGEELAGLGGYTIWNSQNYLDPSFTDGEGEEKKEETTAEETVAEARDIGSGGRGGSSYQTRGGSQYHEQGGFAGGPTKSFGNTERDNYGYINKPSGMGLASMLPGPLGMAGKAVNLGINMNNVSAVNEARSRLGLKDQGFMGRLGGTFKDKQGQVADVTIDDGKYSIGFEALSPTGRTNMTPEEAAKRAQALGTKIVETPKEQVKEIEARFKEDNPQTGFFASVKNTVSSIFDAINPFDDEEESRYARDYFPDAPASTFSSSGYGGDRGDRGYDGSSYSGQNAGQDTPSERGPGPGMGLGSDRGETGASTSEADRGGGGVTSGGGGLW